MGAFRTDLWPIYAPSSIQNGLRDWSAIDTFPIVAPLYLGNALNPGETTVYQDLSNQPDLNLAFSDYHAALQVQFTPIRRIYASGYHGTLEVSNNTSSTTLSVDDSYKWFNTTGQVTFETNFGPRVLASFQALTSSFELTHDYQLIDQLDVFTNRDLFESQRLIEQPVADRNTIRESALSMHFAYAQSSQHYIEAGIKQIWTDSKINQVASHTLTLVDQVFLDPIDSLEHELDSFRTSGAHLARLFILKTRGESVNKLDYILGSADLDGLFKFY